MKNLKNRLSTDRTRKKCKRSCKWQLSFSSVLFTLAFLLMFSQQTNARNGKIQSTKMPNVEGKLSTVDNHLLPVNNPTADKVSSTNFQSSSDANSKQSQSIEKLAIRIMKTDLVKKAISDGVELYKASKIASKPEALRYARSAVEETAMFSSLYAAMDGFSDPSFVWVYAPPHKWNGYYVPGSRWYADNADTFYRTLVVDENSSYEIQVYASKKLPAQLSLMVYGWVIHDGTDPRNDVPLGTLDITDTTPRNADGSITVTAGPDPANGRSNHIQIKPGAKQILVREIRGDWSLPSVKLAVKRVKGDVPKIKTLEEMSKKAAMYIGLGVVAVGNISIGFGELKENQPGEPRVRWIEETGSNNQKLTMDEPVGPDRALGFLSPFLFNLKMDEAFIVTFDMLECGYLSINTYRPFMLSPEHVYHSSSLNNFQAKPNPDGTITFVFSRVDPGVYNWIDFSGIPYGEVGVRWQNLKRPVVGSLKNAVHMAKTVKLADLRKELPSTTVWITPQERVKQQENRAKQYKIRCLGTPCEVGGELDKPY